MKPMKLNSIVRLTLCCALALNFSACATDPHAQRIHQAKDAFHTRTTYAQGIVAGAAVGALAGLLIVGLTGGRSGTRLIAAGIGAATGAAVGAAVANQKIQQRRHYQQAEGVLDKAILRASNTRQEAAKFNATLAGELGSVQAEARSQQAALEDSRAVLESVNKEIRQQNSNLQNATAKGVSAEECARLHNEINGLQAERTQLEGYIDRLTPTARAKTNG